MNDHFNYNWKPVEGQIMTRWAFDVDPQNPLPEYPRPQFKRENWINLNGLWDYAIKAKSEQLPDLYEGKILVPFPVESALSGVKRKLKPNQTLWYHRIFQVPESWKGMKVLLHFGASDWDTTVWINGTEVGNHKGGYTPFYFDISENINPDEVNDMIVSVWDPTDKGTQERGKQVLNPSDIYYTAVSGIWQTVWLEPVQQTYIKSLMVTPDLDSNKVQIELEIENAKIGDFIKVEIKEGDSVKSCYNDRLDHTLTLEIPSPILWEPSNPFLYNLNMMILRDGTLYDEVYSYFGMRKIELEKDNHGIYRIKLNNKSIFQYGILDQGYWPDGLYTAPTDEALRYDIEITKKLGFNMIRKHVKIEPARWYYYCDKLGLLVWQDMPNGGKPGYMIYDSTEIKEEIDRDETEKQTYYEELESMISALYNFPSILVWVPFNEGWGQFDTEEVVKKVREIDSSRLIDSASGWFDKGVGDICDLHHYPRPKMPYNIGKRAAVVGEFGGLGLRTDKHMWSFSKAFVYRDHSNPQGLLEKYERLLKSLKKLIDNGLVAAIYTQITDVEGEVNGILTYDREIIKMDIHRLKELNLSLYLHFNN